MKVALCLSGLARGVIPGYLGHKVNILDKHNCDVFIQTWKSPEARLATRLYNFKKCSIEEEFDFKPFLKNILDKDWPLFPSKNKYSDYVKHRRHNTMCMFYNIKKCNDLKKQYEKEHNFIYDLVIRSRLDQMPYKIPRKIEIKSDIIYLPRLGIQAKCTDTIAFGSSRVMDLYSSVWDCLNDDLIFQAYNIKHEHAKKEFNSKCYAPYLDPHSLLEAHLENLKERNNINYENLGLWEFPVLRKSTGEGEKSELNNIEGLVENWKNENPQVLKIVCNSFLK